MPAASEGPPARAGQPLPELPRTWRPLGLRIMGLVASLGLGAVCAVSWLTFDAETRDRFTVLQRGTLIFFALLAGVLMYALIRSRAVALRDRLVVINGYRHREFAWAQIVAVHLPPGAPWVTLDLADGGTASVMGIQSSDGERARRAYRELRAIVASSSAGPGTSA